MADMVPTLERLFILLNFPPQPLGHVATPIQALLPIPGFTPS